MIMHNSLPVTDDVVDRILLFCPTFSSLLATILTAKSIYTVFQTHPKSILRAVAFNITGPALTQALSCIRHPGIVKQPHKYSTQWDSDDSLSDINAKNNVDMDIDVGDLSAAPITAAETHSIAANAKVVARLEDLFSARYYDRRSSTSQLSEVESRNFRVAVYHCMLYSSIFHPATWHVSSDEDDDDASQSAAGIKRREAVNKRMQFLSTISTPELLRMHSVAEFLKEIFAWCIRTQGYPDNIRDLAPAVGPTLVLESFDDEQDSLEPFEDILDLLEEDLDVHPMATEYLSGPLVKVLEARQEKPPQADFTHWHSISARISEKHIQCDRCQKPYDFEFFHDGALIRIGSGEITEDVGYTPQALYRFLKGSLRSNRVEMDDLNQEARKYGSNPLPKIWTYLWDLNLVRQQPHDGQQGTPKLVDWNKDDFLCHDCMRGFLIENLWVWLWHTKTVAGTIMENCWYGYNCRTQKHKTAHAEKLNHLCEQTRH